MLFIIYYLYFNCCSLAETIIALVLLGLGVGAAIIPVFPLTIALVRYVCIDVLEYSLFQFYQQYFSDMVLNIHYNSNLFLANKKLIQF